MTIVSAYGIHFLKLLEFLILHSWLQSEYFVSVEMSDFF